MMKKLLPIVGGIGLLLSATSAISKTTAVASGIWQAEAIKDSQKELVITPTRALMFRYDPSTKGFNQDTGTFSVAIRGDHSAENTFKLEARVDDGNNTLRQMGGNSTLSIGAYFGSIEVGSSKGGDGGVGPNANWTKLIDSTDETGIASGLWDLTKSAGTSTEELTARENFKFSVKKATSDGTTAVTEFNTLPNGMWQGEVAVVFRATWDTVTTQ